MIFAVCGLSAAVLLRKFRFYTEETYRGRGIAGALIDRVCCDMKEKKIHVLYLITDHTSFYERYGWQYLCEVEEDCGGTARMYVRYLE